MDHSFDKLFRTLTGHSPFPWQSELYGRFIAEHPINIPRTADLPTGLGKTSVIAVWLLALIKRPEKMPRRIIYVVNRRTVVDQTTAEVERLRENLPELGSRWFDSLAISTLRGQFADNQEWREDPSRPAVICGTVDMIGSRLLFEGYRIGFRSRPLHAGFLGQDALLIHDEAHLEPAFQGLVETIQEEQKRERKRNGELPWPSLRVMALSATARGSEEESNAEHSKSFGLTDEEKHPPDAIPDPPTKPIHHLWRRLKATKSLYLHAIDDEKTLADKMAELALKHKDANAAVLVFLRTIDDVNKVRDKLIDKKNGVPSGHVQQLTGTMRGYERDQLVNSNPVFARFMPPGDRSKGLMPAGGAVYLVCTSAGEVGVNLSADHMVCDLPTFDSMAQRLGRVNRFGDRDDTQVDVVHPTTFDDKKPNPQRKATLELLQQLNGEASAKALGELPADLRRAAFAPEPTILPATDILFDAWALTTIKGKMPGRPPVAPYLHGVAEWEPPRTSIAWRKEVEVITDDLIAHQGEDFPQELLAAYPIKPHELLNDRADRIYSMLQALIAEPSNSVKGEKRQAALDRAHRNAKASIWLIDNSGTVTVTTLGTLLESNKKRAISLLEDGTVLLPPLVGGLSAGLLNPQSEHADDVADSWLHEDGQPRRGRVWDKSSPPVYEHNGKRRPMALIRSIDTDPLADEMELLDEASSAEVEIGPDAGSKTTSECGRFWHWYVRPRDAEDATRASSRPIRLDHHSSDVANRAQDIVKALKLPAELQRSIVLAAELHDVGKRREIWQRSIGNPNPTDWYAKSGKPADGKRWRTRHLSDYRHEFGSLLDTLDSNDELANKLTGLNDEMRDVVRHLIAAHHGYARPHFPPEAYDHERYNTQQNEDAAHEVMRRYARLQRRYGRWGLAYLESLLRAADWAASANPSELSAGEGGNA
jgi:CRISPR-associated endonuclease/helicase Cas3